MVCCARVVVLAAVRCGRAPGAYVLRDEWGVGAVCGEERGVSRERSPGHCVHVLRRTATAGKAIFTRETR